MVPTRRPSAFTLVELLVVIAVITLLIAILLPALESAQKSAKLTQCASNQRQLGISLTSYAEVFSRFPVDYFNTASDNQSWPASLAKQNGFSVSVLGGGGTYASNPVNMGASTYPYFRCSVVPNYYVLNQHFTRAFGAGIASPTDLRLNNPLYFNRPNMVLMVDGFLITSNTRPTAVPTQCNPVTTNYIIDLARHNGKWVNGPTATGLGAAGTSVSNGLINVLFTDGHVNATVPYSTPIRGGPNFAAGPDDRLWDIRQP